jgi:nitrogenase molybdenum-iron protein alpha chain
VIQIDGEETEIAANSRTIPGILTSRGCCYAGCKGVVIGPVKDVVTITHGPIGCGYYSWLTRRNKARPAKDGMNFLSYCFSTDMQESDIVFGGAKKLAEAINEANEIFHPRAIFVAATCPVGLIGDDINAVASAAQEELGIPVIAFSCEGYKGVSQSAGHHIANNQIVKHIIGKGEREVGKYAINILGEYNIGGDAWEIERVLEKIGYEVVSTFTGNASEDDLSCAHLANLNIVQCHRSINYIAEMLHTRYGTDWLKVNFIGISGISQSLRDMAKYFGDPELIQRTERVIAEETAAIEPEMEYYKTRLTGKTAALYVGGARAHHYQLLLEDLGMTTVMAGYEFAHREDYEGRKVLPFVKTDADSKNIETLSVEPDEKYYRVYHSPEQSLKLGEEMPLNYYDGMIPDMDDGKLIIDDLNHYETEQMLKLLKPDVFFSGIKDKFVAQKEGTLSRQLHSYDYSGPYAGFKGAVNFARDVDMGIYTPTWRYSTAPWKTEPTLEGTFAGGEI